MFDLTKKECFFRVREVRGDRKIFLTHFFKLPTFEDWVDYHRGVSQIGLSKGKDTVELSNVMQEKDREFWLKLILRVEGYGYKGKPLMEMEGWKDLIPLPHVLEAVSGFMLFVREDVPDEGSLVEEEVLDLAEDFLEMRFAALQDGQSHAIRFFFRSPEAKDYIRYSRASSKMQLVRTRERNVSAIRVPTDIHPFVKLFEKLIEKVEGYGYEDKDLMKAPDWAKKIDAFHQKEAIRELFTASLEEPETKTVGD